MISDTGHAGNMADLEKQLRDEAGRSGLSMFALAKRAGLGYASVHGFCMYDRSISLGSATKLAAALGLELRKRTTRTKG